MQPLGDMFFNPTPKRNRRTRPLYHLTPFAYSQKTQITARHHLIPFATFKSYAKNTKKALTRHYTNKRKELVHLQKQKQGLHRRKQGSEEIVILPPAPSPGCSGAHGLPGPMGANGVAGNQGFVGPQGPQGPAGSSPLLPKSAVAVRGQQNITTTPTVIVGSLLTLTPINTGQPNSPTILITGSVEVLITADVGFASQTFTFTLSLRRDGTTILVTVNKTDFYPTTTLLIDFRMPTDFTITNETFTVHTYDLLISVNPSPVKIGFQLTKATWSARQTI